MAPSRKSRIRRAEGKPTRLEQLRRYNDAAKGGFYAPMTGGDPFAPGGHYASGGGIANDPSVYVDSPSMLDRGPRYNPYVSDMDRGRRGQDRTAALAAWLRGLPPGGGGGGGGRDRMSRFEALFAEMYPGEDIEAAIRSGYGAQRSAIDDAYGAAMGRLGEAYGSATTGVRQEGAALQEQLGALGIDARQQFGQARQALLGDYRAGRQGVNAETAGLMRDLRSGAGAGSAATQALRQQAGVLRAGSKAAQASQVGLNDRYSQLMAQELNNRQASGATVTTASLGDLARVNAQARADAETERAGRLADVSAGMAGDLAQAKAAEAKEKYQFLSQFATSSGKDGKRALSTTAIKAADERWGPMNYSDQFKGVLGYESDDKDEQNVVREAGMKIMDALAAGGNLTQINADFEAKAAENPDAPGVSETRQAIHAAMRAEALRIRSRKRKRTPQEIRYLRAQGYDV